MDSAIIIRNGTVITSTDIRKADLYLVNGKIEALLDRDKLTSEDFNYIENMQEIDATGKLILPGGIDAHTHLDMPFMGTFTTDDFRTGTVAAAYGGTTSIIDYVIPQKGQSLIEALDIWKKKAKGKAVIDYFFHMAIVPPVEDIIPELPKLKEAGINSIKCFLAYKNSLMLDDQSIYKLLQEAKKHDILVCFHAENGEIIELMTKYYLEQGETEPIFHALSRPAALEGESVGKILKFAQLVDTPVYFVHLSTKDAVKEIKRARKRGQTVYSETCPQYLLLDQDKYFEPDFGGAKYVMSPPLRKKEHNKALTKALKKGHIDVIATDHCPFNFHKEKQIGRNDFTKIPNGIPGIETRMSLMFNLFNEENLPLTGFVKLNCTNPARIFGLKNKGDIVEGYDADIVIWNPDTEWTIKSDELHENVDYSPFEGFKLKGKPEMIFVKGKVFI